MGAERGELGTVVLEIVVPETVEAVVKILLQTKGKIYSFSFRM